MARNISNNSIADWRKWSEENQISVDQFQSLFCNELLSDVTFVVGRNKKIIPGHKLVLSMCSWDFHNVFYNIKLDKTDLLIEDFTEDVFLCFLEYCYTRKMSLLEKVDPLEVLRLACRFHMNQLIEICELKLAQKVKRATCLKMYRENHKYLLSKEYLWLKESILKEIGLNFHYFIFEDRSKQFLDLPREALRNLLDMESEIRANEIEIFYGLMMWAEHNCWRTKLKFEPLSFRKVLFDVFYKIRFPIMKMEWFLEVIAKYPRLLTVEEISNISLFIRGDTKTCPDFPYCPRSPISMRSSRNDQTTGNKITVGVAHERFFVMCMAGLIFYGLTRFVNYLCK